MDMLLVVLAFLVWYWYLVQTAPAEMTVCPYCNDLVYVLAGVLVRCPSCRKLFVR